MKKIFIVIATLYLSIIFFMPKEEILYTGLNQLSKQKINFDIESVNDYGFVEKVNSVKLFYDGSRVIKIDNIKIFPFIFFNLLTLNNISIDKNFKSMLNIEILKAKITNMLYKPFILNIKLFTDIGNFLGTFDIKNGKLKLLLKPTKKFNSFKYKRYFKKTKEGYLYESIIRY